MGLLDDAIREHLELKRRRGADPTEVEREEAEALGPVRRADVAESDDPADAPAPDEPLAHDGQYEDAHGGFEDPGGAYAADLPEPEPAPYPEPAAYAEPEVHHAAEPVPAPAPERPHEDVHAEPQDTEPPQGDPWRHQATREFSSDELSAALHDHDAAPPAPPAPPPASDVVPADDEGEPEAEDVLEETPDFLQETPEHDRLWFEQKPPKDFDF
jgi:hypothetical protein